MATFLDVSLLQSVDAIFPALLVFAIVFAILNKTHALGKSIGLDAIIAIVAAFMVMLSRPLIELINYIIPWFVVAIIFFLLLLLIFRVFGAEDKDIFEYVKGDKAVGWVIIAICLVIVAAGLGKVFGQGLTEQAFDAGTAGNVTYDENGVATQNFERSVTATLFHPKVLGVIIVFTIAIFAVALLTGQESPGKGMGGGGGHNGGGHGH